MVSLTFSPSKRWVKSCSLGRATRFSSFQFICNFPRAKNPHAKAESSLTNRKNASLILANFLWAIINHSKSFMILFEQNSFILNHFSIIDKKNLLTLFLKLFVNSVSYSKYASFAYMHILFLNCVLCHCLAFFQWIFSNFIFISWNIAPKTQFCHNFHA